MSKPPRNRNGELWVAIHHSSSSLSGAGDPLSQDYLKCPGGSWSSEVLVKAVGGQGTQRVLAC